MRNIIIIVIIIIYMFYLFDTNCMSSIMYVYMFFKGCSVDGNPGDSTVQGTCPGTNQVCAEDGTCQGTNFLCFKIFQNFGIWYNFIHDLRY